MNTLSFKWGFGLGIVKLTLSSFLYNRKIIYKSFISNSKIKIFKKNNNLICKYQKYH